LAQVQTGRKQRGKNIEKSRQRQLKLALNIEADTPHRLPVFSISNSYTSHLALGHVMGEAAAHAP